MTHKNNVKFGGKQIRNARSKASLINVVNLSHAIDSIKTLSYTKFDSTVEFIAKLGVNPKYSDQIVRGVVVLPFGTGKIKRIAVICPDHMINLAMQSGANIAGSVDIVDSIKSGIINFDICISTPDMLSIVSPLARILGPKGLMPNLKLGTITNDIATVIKNFKNGQIDYRVDKSGIIHVGVGKLSFSNKSLISNIITLFASIMKSKPCSIKDNYFKALYLSSTMSPAIQLDVVDMLNNVNKLL